MSFLSPPPRVSVCVCVCEMCAHARGGKVDLGCLLQLLAILSFETGSLSELEVHQDS